MKVCEVELLIRSTKGLVSRLEKIQIFSEEFNKKKYRNRKPVSIITERSIITEESVITVKEV